MANILRNMRFHSVSLVDSPANVDSQVIIAKRDDDYEEEEIMDEEEGEITEEEHDEIHASLASGETCPVEGCGYVKGKMRKNRATKKSDTLDGSRLSSMSEEQNLNKSTKSVKETSAMSQTSTSVTTDGLPEDVAGYIQELEKAVLDLSENMDSEEELQKFADKANSEVIQKMQAAEDRAERAESIAKAERDLRIDREMIAKAETLSYLPNVGVSDLANLLKSTQEALADDEYARLVQLLDAASEAIRQSSLFAEVGKSVSAVGNAYEKMIGLSKSEMEQDPTLTEASAIAKVAHAQPSLYREYLEEQRG